MSAIKTHDLLRTARPLVEGLQFTIVWPIAAEGRPAVASSLGGSIPTQARLVAEVSAAGVCLFVEGLFRGDWNTGATARHVILDVASSDVLVTHDSETVHIDVPSESWAASLAACSPEADAAPDQPAFALLYARGEPITAALPGFRLACLERPRLGVTSATHTR